MALIEVETASKVYRAGYPDELWALREVSLSVAAGEVVVLEGPSGSGKTTLLSLIGCMARPTSGRVTVGSREVSRLPERFLTGVRRGTFGFIFQQFHLLPEVHVLDNVMLPLLPQGLPAAEMRRRAEALLERYGLARHRLTRVGRLSGGEQQRVAIARALVNAPQVLIADEPTAHLDRTLAEELLGHLATLNRAGLTLVIATHDPFLADSTLVSRRIPLRDGRRSDGLAR